MYTLIIMSSDKNSIRQHAIGRGHLLLLSCVILGLLFAAIGGFTYGLSEKRQRVNTENELQTRMDKEIQELTQAKRQVESELAAVNEEMNDIRQIAEKIREALGILGQGGEPNMTSSPGESDPQQTDISAFTDAAPDPHRAAGVDTQYPERGVCRLSITISSAYQKHPTAFRITFDPPRETPTGKRGAIRFLVFFALRMAEPPR